jgi:hypothetical protein
MRPFIVALALAGTVASGGPTYGQGQIVQYFGAGIGSCASWTPDIEYIMDGWILGYWSGLNENYINHLAGHTTDGVGIVEETRLYCRGHPSDEVLQVIFKIWSRFQSENR